ncbi:MAG: hypothetical protein OCD00_01825 [Colwellia sp.]
MKIYKITLLFLMSFISAPIFAHAGHDHNSTMANLVHLLWIAPAIVAVAMLYSKLLKKDDSIKSNKK